MSTIFVTVGSTKFDRLIDQILKDETLDQLINFNFNKIIMQIGSSSHDIERLSQIKQGYSNIVEIELYDYKPSIREDIERADVVIGHAGAGTCLEVLRNHKRLLIVVNDSLMGNHQNELADQLSEDKFVVKTTIDRINNGLAKICDSNTMLNKFPVQQADKFEQIFDEALKKVTH